MLLQLSHYKGKRLKAVYRLQTSSSYNSQGSLHIICSSNTFVKRPLRELRKSNGKIMVFLLILVTDNRKMEAWQSSCHSPT